MAPPSETPGGEGEERADGDAHDAQAAEGAFSSDAPLRVDTLLTALAFVGPWQLFERTLARLKLPYGDAAIVVALSQAPASAESLTEWTGIDRRSVRRVLSRLRQRGLIDVHHARVQRVGRHPDTWELTVAGSELASELLQQAGDQLRFILSSMSRADRDALIAAVGHLATVLSADDLPDSGGPARPSS
jgi:DNA-binding MarR family transcriptional regulator